VIGDGTAELESVETFDTRVNCRFILRHKIEGKPGFVSKLEIYHRTRDIEKGTRKTKVCFDRLGTGDLVAIHVDRALVIGKNPLTGKKIEVKSALEAVVAAFDLLPHDTRAEEELQTEYERLKVAAASYLGDWYVEGDPCQLVMTRLKDMMVELMWLTGRLPEHVDLFYQRLDANGRLPCLAQDGARVTLSADGQRMEIVGYNPTAPKKVEWYTRKPLVPYRILIPTSEKEPQSWLFTTSRPTEGWEKPDFDAGQWTEADGGFGDWEWPTAFVRTHWKTKDIWLRKSFVMKEPHSCDMQFRLLMAQHGETYINGVPVFNMNVGSPIYYRHVLIYEGRDALRVGVNTIAVHCQQKLPTGSHYFDLGLIELLPVPK